MLKMKLHILQLPLTHDFMVKTLFPRALALRIHYHKVIKLNDYKYTTGSTEVLCTELLKTPYSERDGNWSKELISFIKKGLIELASSDLTVDISSLEVVVGLGEGGNGYSSKTSINMDLEGNLSEQMFYVNLKLHIPHEVTDVDESGYVYANDLPEEELFQARDRLLMAVEAYFKDPINLSLIHI